MHRWEHPDGRYFELASNVLSAEQIEQRGLPPAAKDYGFHSSTPMVPRELLDEARAERNGLGESCTSIARDRDRTTAMYEAAMNYFPDDAWTAFEESEAFKEAENRG